MLDQSGSGEHDSAVPASWGQSSAPSTSIAEPVLSGDYGAIAPPEAPQAPAHSMFPWVVAVVGALVLLVGGGFFAVTAFAATGGASSPEEAVDAMIAAANDEDFITMAELLEPAERRTIAEPMLTEVLPELIRLGVLDDSADAGGVDGFDVELTDVTYRVDPIAGHADMVSVTFTGGQATGEFTSAEFPFGDEFRDRFRDEIADEPRTTEDIQPSDNPLVLVERDGRWYFSAMFSMAEAARLEAGQPMPSLADVPPALGSPSPEAAVESLINELVELDVAGMVGRMDPEEMAVLYRYSPLFLDDAESEIAELQSLMDEENVRWNVSDLDVDVVTDGDDASVTIRGFRLDVTADEVDLSFTWARDRLAGTLDAGESGRGSFEATPTRWVVEGVVDGERIELELLIDSAATTLSVAGEVAGTTFSGELDVDESGTCSTYWVTASDGTAEEGCAEETFGAGGGFIVQQYAGFFESIEREFVGPTIATRRTNDAWFVSPVTTVFDYYINSLQELDEGEFEQMLDSMNLASSVGFGAIESVDEFGGGGSSMFDDDVTFTDDVLTQEEIDEMFENLDLENSGEAFEGFADATVGSSSIAAVPPGETRRIGGSLTSGIFDEVVVDLAGGDMVIVTVEAATGGGLDPTVEIFGPDGSSLGYNDDADSSAGIGLFDSRLEITADTAGTHVIEIRSFADMGSGDYSVTISRS